MTDTVTLDREVVESAAAMLHKVGIFSISYALSAALADSDDVAPTAHDDAACERECLYPNCSCWSS